MPFHPQTNGYIDITADCTFNNFGAIGAGTRNVRARIDDPNIEVYGFVILGAVPPAGQMTVTLPDYVGQIPLSGAEVQFGAAWYLDDGVRHYPGTVRLANDVDLQFIHPEPANFGLVSNVAPFAWGIGDQLGWNISYERV